MNEVQVRVQEELKKILSNPRQAIKIYAQALEEAENEIQSLIPKVQMHDIVMSTDKLIEMSAVAKVLSFRNMGRNNLFSYLQNKQILRYNNEPYQQYVQAGYFKMTPKVFYVCGEEKTYIKTMVTQKGVTYIGKLLKEDGYERNPR